MKSASSLHDHLLGPSLRSRIETIESLPTLPELYNQLLSELSSADVSLKRVADLVTQDVAISAKLLQVVNSAYFGMGTRVNDVHMATNYLGVDTVKGIVLSAGVYSNTGSSGIAGFTPSTLYDRGVAVGTKARFIAYSFGLTRQHVDDALTAGLLHDVGKLVLMSSFEQEFKAACELSRKDSIPLHVAEEKTLGANDAAIGGFLLATWGLSDGIIEAVAVHYQPSLAAQPELNATAAVHLSYASECGQQGTEDQSAFDIGYTDTLGITNQLSQFSGLTPEAVTQGTRSR